MTNTFTLSSPAPLASAALLSDRDLLETTVRVATCERRTTAELLALLAEVDSRRLHLGEGYSSLFTYCTQRLHLSESAAYARITAARAARRFPTLLTRLARGDVTLTSISLLGAHLTYDNHESLLDAARHASRRDVERLVASLYAQPDFPARVRRMPGGDRPSTGGVTASRPSVEMAPFLLADSQSVETGPTEPGGTNTPDRFPASENSEASPRAAGAAGLTTPPATINSRTTPRPAIAPLSADRYLLRMTIDATAHDLLERARALLRHTIPSGDPALIVGRALIVLVEQLEKRKAGRRSRPDDPRPAPKPSHGRHVPAAVRRAIWSRDQGRCAFVGPHGRCSETGFLEYHHLVPFAAGGTTDVENLELRCRAHNAYEAMVWFGEEGSPGAKAPGR